MNKFIEYDLHNGIMQIKCAVMNVIKDLTEIKEFEFIDVPLSIIIDALIEHCWSYKYIQDFSLTSGQAIFSLYKNPGNIKATMWANTMDGYIKIKLNEYSNSD